MRSLFLLLTGLLFVQLVYAQKHDNIWFFGAGGGNQSPSNDSFGITLLDFTPHGFPLVINRQDIGANFFTTNATFCDSAGNLLFYTNGDHIYNRNHQIMSGGNHLATNIDGWGYRLPQGAIALPYPGHLNQYVLITIEKKNIPGRVFGWNLFSHTIDIGLNGGLGAVTQKRNLLLQDTVTYGMLAATKHANGRDWWFIVPKSNSGIYYIGLLSPSGIQIDTFQSCLKITDGLGQATFSPDGTKYIRTEDDDLLTPNQISIFDFDRCTGELYNCRTQFYHGVDNFGMGCAVSPNSRYLYVMATYHVFQYDLSDDDIFSTEQLVEVWDGTKYYNIWPVDFYLGQPGPDGRIYVNSTNSSVSMHYINFPDRPGTGCQFRQNGIWTPTLIQVEMPNLPNYRLGPVDGSACDTLGLDNHPLCNWRWEQEDTTALLRITFTDLSAYEPDTWHWTFGDGMNSQDTSPVHSYAQAGIYQVCLTVSNSNSADTLCRWVNVGVSSVQEWEQTERLGMRVMPNPANESLTLLASEGQQGVQFELVSLTGQVVRSAVLGAGTQALSIDTRALPTGVYFYRLRTEQGVWLQSGKVVITH